MTDIITDTNTAILQIRESLAVHTSGSMSSASGH